MPYARVAGLRRFARICLRRFLRVCGLLLGSAVLPWTFAAHAQVADTRTPERNGFSSSSGTPEGFAQPARVAQPGRFAQPEGSAQPDRFAQPADAALPDAPQAADETLSVGGLPRRVGRDMLGLAQFPRKVDRADLRWLFPLTGAAVAAFSFDEKAMAEVVTQNPATNLLAADVSDGLRDGFIAMPVAMFAASFRTHDDHLREAGLLGGEAMTDAFLAGECIKLVSFRERPNTDRAEGSFYRTAAGANSSFVSGHALTAWSSAAVIASVYPNRWVQIGAYTAASGVSLTRVLAQQHFPSDVLLGSAAGWLIGRYVYRHHARSVPRDSGRAGSGGW